MRPQTAVGGLVLLMILVGIGVWRLTPAERIERSLPVTSDSEELDSDTPGATPLGSEPRAASPEVHQRRFVAALAHLVRSGGDTISLTHFHATDDHLKTLANVERLRVLRIDGGALSPAAGQTLAAMPHLEQLHLRNIAIDDATLTAIAGSDSLWLMNLAPANVSPQAVERLADMPRLRQLRLALRGGGDSYASAVAAIQGLRSVHLIGTGMTNEGLKPLAAMPQLQSLYLDDTRITETGWSWLFANHPHLHVHIDQQHHDRDPQRH